MVPHHHHESFALEQFGEPNQQEVHSHPHDGTHHHDHDKEESDKESEHSTEHSFPQHFHLSATDDLDFARVNQAGGINYIADIQDLISSEWLPEKPFCPDIISLNTYFALFTISQYNPGANGLRGPPSIA